MFIPDSTLPSVSDFPVAKFVHAAFVHQFLNPKHMTPIRQRRLDFLNMAVVNIVNYSLWWHRRDIQISRWICLTSK